MGPRFNEVPRDLENWFVKSRASYMYLEVQFSYISLTEILLPEEYHSLYQGLCYIEVC